ncbi:MAG: hypothetical protein EZS28_033913 [Streblomastix strix]|uniref:Uncharacterized protein n=1 Tax=Streblomastix strix TaxID=222440 RepID=A0A5J4UKH4_9EUKA|nr:MAG: hypothetical protein EZS28_033913 [Streblomastix strix]
MAGRLHIWNKQTSNKILQLATGSRCLQSQCIQRQLGKIDTIPSSFSELGEGKSGQVTSGDHNSTCGSGKLVCLSGEQSLNDASSVKCPIRKYESSIRDKHAEGEALFRSIVKEVELDYRAFNNITCIVCQEIWRKRRAGLHLLNDYMKETNFNEQEIQAGRVDGNLAIALSLREEKGRTKMIQDAMKMKTHVGVTLSLFSEIRDVIQSPMIQAIVKRLYLDKQSQAKYDKI